MHELRLNFDDAFWRRYMPRVGDRLAEERVPVSRRIAFKDSEEDAAQFAN